MNTASRKTLEDERPRLGRRVRLTEVHAAGALERAKHAFGQEGFTELAEIDLRDALARKVDHDIGPYWLIELCHPVLSSRGLAVDRAAGLIMPFKVAIWQEGTDAIVAALEPEAASSEALTELVREAHEHIDRALAHVTG